MYADNTYQELSRQSLVGQAVALNNAAHGHFRAAVKAENAAVARKNFYETHGAVGRVTFMKIVEYATFVVGLICIYWIDVLLFGASAEYIASLLGSDNPIWAQIAKFVVPACFLGIEVLIALQIEKSRHEERFAFGSGMARRAWIALGILVALVMPLAARATAAAAGAVAENDLPGTVIVVLGIVSFTAHVLVLFGGSLAQEAKTYFAFAAVRAWHDTRATLAARDAARTLAAANAMFIGYVHAWKTHNQRFGPEQSGPFDGKVVEFLKRQFPQITSGAAAAVFREEEPA